MLGSKKAFRRYIKRMPRKEAEAIARRLAVEHADQLLFLVGAVPEADRKDIEAAGGLPAFREDTGKESLGPMFLVNAKAQLIKSGLAYLPKRRADIESTLALSWDALFNQWVRVREPSRTRNHAALIRLLKDYFGERDCRDIKPLKISQFRDHLLKSKSRLSVSVHLNQMRAMFKAAAQDPNSPFHGMSNPCSGIQVLGKTPTPTDADKAFTPEQVRRVLETAARVKFGGEKHPEIIWMLRLLAFTGARITEISMLQSGDVLEQDGVTVIKIRHTDAITGQEHPLKSVKTETRTVPLHPDILGFYEYAQSFAKKDDFIFGNLKWDKHNKTRATWLISNFSAFLKTDCGIVEPNKALKLYSFRHRFHDAMDEAEIPDKQQRRLTGHALDIHEKYGSDLKKLASYVAKIKPLG